MKKKDFSKFQNPCKPLRKRKFCILLKFERKFEYNLHDLSFKASQNGGDAPTPPERCSSYAVMTQQSALRSNTSATSNVPLGQATIKRVSFHDPNANIEQPRNVSSVTSSTPSSITMDTIREDPNVSYFRLRSHLL